MTDISNGRGDNYYFCSVTWINITGTRYCKGSVVVISSGLVSVFEDIIMDDNLFFF